MIVRTSVRSTATEKTTTLVAGRPSGAYGRPRLGRFTGPGGVRPWRRAFGLGR